MDLENECIENRDVKEKVFVNLVHSTVKKKKNNFLRRWKKPRENLMELY